jgi:hypothetical protein
MSPLSLSLSIVFLRFLCETLLLVLYRLGGKPTDGEKVSSPGQIHAVLPLPPPHMHGLSVVVGFNQSNRNY